MKKIFIIIFFLVGILNSEAENSRYLLLVDSAENYIKRESWEKAEILLIEAMREEPANFHNAMLFSNLGLVRENTGNIEGAIEAYRLGLSISPGSTVLLNNKGRLLLEKKDYGEALECIEKSLTIDSSQQFPLLMRALINEKEGNFNEAGNDYNRLIELDSLNVSALIGLGRLAEHKGDFHSAYKLYNRALEINDTEEIRSSIILLKINAQNYSEASEEIRKALELYPDSGELYLWRGLLHKLNYRNQEAEADRKNALAHGADPELVEFYLPVSRR